MKTRRMILGVLAGAAVSVWGAAASDYTVSDVHLSSRAPWETGIDITFRLTAPTTTAKAVELDIRAMNGADDIYISDGAISTRLAAAKSGLQRITWRPDVDHPGRYFGDLKVSVAVKGEVEGQPAYMLVDLTNGSVGYARKEQFEKARLRNFNFTDYMALRYIPPTTSDEWKALSGGNDWFWYGTDENDGAENFKSATDLQRENRRVKVRLTKGFYMGIYPMYKGHLSAFESEFSRNGSGYGDVATGLSYERIRGADTVGGYNYPTTDNVAPNSILGKIRERTGLKFDLPTSFQWEYAARAGSTNVFLHTDSAMPDTSLFQKQKDASPHDSGLVNAWGLYGMIGSCHHWTTTLGRSSDTTGGNNFCVLTGDTVFEDPVGDATTYDHGYRITRGSHSGAAGNTTGRLDGKSYDIRYRVYRIAYTYAQKANNPSELQFCGFRLCLPLDE